MYKTIPSPEQIFDTFIKQWYPDPATIPMSTRPDMYTYAEPHTSVHDINTLGQEDIVAISQQINLMFTAAQEDWQQMVISEGRDLLASIDALDTYFDHEHVLSLINNSDPNDFSNKLLVTIGEFGVLLGYTFIERLPDVQWFYADPYWESALYDEQTGFMIPVFSWARKKFSDYGIDDGYRAKVLACIETINEKRTALN